MGVNSLGTIIRRARLRAGLQRWEVAKRVGVCRQTVIFWELGYRKPDLRTLPLLASVLAVSFDDLLEAKIKTP